jgi:hypothetical protein
MRDALSSLPLSQRHESNAQPTEQAVHRLRTSADRQGSGRRHVAWGGISVCGFRETCDRESTSPACHPETTPTQELHRHPDHHSRSVLHSSG